MSYLIPSNTWYGTLRTIHCLKMLKRFYDAGYNPVKVSKNFCLHAASQYGYSNLGEPLELFAEMVKQIFPNVTIYGDYDDYGILEDKIRIIDDMNIPVELWEKYNLSRLNKFEYYSIFHIKGNFHGLDFHFLKDYPRTDKHYFETKDEGSPILHFRNENEDEMIIVLDYDYYYSDPDTILQFCLWLKGQMKEEINNEMGIRNQ